MFAVLYWRFPGFRRRFRIAPRYARVGSSRFIAVNALPLENFAISRKAKRYSATIHVGSYSLFTLSSRPAFLVHKQWPTGISFKHIKPMRTSYLICYDISDDKRLRK